MSWYTAAWFGWGLFFAVLEGMALANSRNSDTLSEHVWIFLGLRHGAAWTRSVTGWTRVRRIAVGMFLAALAVHFLVGSNPVGNSVLIATSILLALVVAGTGAVRYLRRSKSPRRLTMATLSSKPPFILRARKAFNAGAMAFAGALATSLITAVQTAHVPQTAEGWTALVLSAVGLGVLAGVTTFKIRNTATVEGSDPLPPPDPPDPLPPAHRLTPKSY